MTKNLNTLFSDMIAAESVWISEMHAAYPGQDVRYSSLSSGKPGTALNAAYVAFVEASEAARQHVNAAA